MMLALLVGIDTESDNQWSAQSRVWPTFENLYALPVLHALFRRHLVRPTYLVTYPVVRDQRAAEVLRALHGSGTCEIGSHHHAWETPPCSPEDAARHSYALELPQTQFEAQLRVLTDAIGEAIGQAPVSYRSGRFGFSAAHVSPLERNGYLIDSSVAPLFQEAHKGGPDFVAAPLTPYYLAYDSATTAGSSHVLELPLSAALNRRVPRVLELAYGYAPHQYTMRRVLRALGIARMVWLRPSYSSLNDMCALAARLARRGVPLLNLLFHSSECIVGGSPYNRTQDELDAFFDRLERFLDYAVTTLGAEPMTFAEFRLRYLASRHTAGASGALARQVS